jgi:prepilin-type N-terminal cleavage/methylation domain-containing protein
MSLLKFNKLLRNQNQKGFSLVELMIALTILAIFAVGIVSAFSGAFQAMADSKHRTVATNLAQKEIEEIRNATKKDEYPFYNEETTKVDGIEYTIITVAQERSDENIADFFTTVSWYNRNGVQKDVRLATLVYNLKTKIDELPQVGRIDLTADPLDMICCQEDQISTITAEVFDKDGERLVPSGTPVSFTTNDEGSLSRDYGLTDSVGRAIAELKIKSIKPAKVWASSGETTSDPVEVKCKPIPYDINLSASRTTVTPGEISIISATVKDSCGNNLEAGSEQVTVNFATDYGYFDGSATTEEVVTVNGIATINLHMSTSGETAIVTATVTPEDGADPPYEPLIDSVEVFCTDYGISIAAEPSTVFPNESAVITVTLTQSGGQIPSGAQISFNTSHGTLSKTTETIDPMGKASVTLSNIPGDSTAKVTAEFVVPDAGGKTISDSVEVKSRQYKMTIEAEPNSITPNSTSVITATLTDYQGNPAADRRIGFFTNRGSLSDYSVYTDSSGKARTTLSGLTAGTKADITAAFGETDVISETVSVTCIDYVLTLTASPANITAGGTSTITATLKNYSGVLQPGKKVTFTTNVGLFTNGRNEIEVNTGTSSNNRGIATATLTINTSGTTATITATSEGAVATTTVTCTNIYIALVTPSNITLSNSSRDVSFDLRLYGGPLTVNRVKAEWRTISSNPTRYERIWISTRTGSRWSSETQIYSGSTNNNGTIRNLSSNFTIPRDATFRIRMRFSSAINSTSSVTRNLIFTFNPEDPNADNYRIEFNIPRS